MNYLGLYLTVYSIVSSTIVIAQKIPLPKDSISLVLERIYETDQYFRLQMDSLIRRNSDDNSLFRQSLTDSIVYYDSVNIIKVADILENYGWLSEAEVGRNANLALFLVIQHAPYKLQLHFEGKVQKAFEQGKLKPAHYALFKDRILLRQGKKQLYGSQIGRLPDTGEKYILPLEDPDKVDARRKSMGLEPLADYVKHWGISWNVQEYKKRDYPNILQEN